MSPVSLQVPSIILPTTFYTIGTLTEDLTDTNEHTSTEFPVEFLHEKEIHIMATEFVVLGIPGNLWCWVELSPYPSVNSLYQPAPLPATAAYWAAIGGGGGALAPVSPVLEVATGVSLTVHTLLLPWTIHSGWARLVVRTPVAAAPLTAFWMIQAMVSGKCA